MKYTIAIAVLLLSMLTSALTGALDANAWGANTSYFADKSNVHDFITNQSKPNGYPQGDTWKQWNYAIYQYNQNEFMWVIGDDYNFDYAQYDGTIGFFGNGVCRWSKDLNGGVGCNNWTNWPGGGIQGTNIYQIHLTDNYKTLQPTKAAQLESQYPSYFAPEIEKVYPEFTYSKLGKKINATYEDNIDYDGKSLMSLSWILSEDMDTGEGQNYEVIDTKVLKWNEQYSYNVSRLGNYILSLGITIRPPGQFTAGKEISPRVQGILIDGKAETLSTTQSDCMEGLCQEKSAWEPCITDVLPFINMAGCISNMGSVISILSFNTLDISGKFDFAENCHTLGQVGTWMNVSNQNRTICPAISSDIRTIITPFVTFAFALLGVKYVTGRMSGANYNG